MPTLRVCSGKAQKHEAQGCCAGGVRMMGLLLKCEGRYRGRGRAAVLAALEAIGEIAWLQE
jgi:hypothetical protein